MAWRNAISESPVFLQNNSSDEDEDDERENSSPVDINEGDSVTVIDTESPKVKILPSDDVTIIISHSSTSENEVLSDSGDNGSILQDISSRVENIGLGNSKLVENASPKKHFVFKPKQNEITPEVIELESHIGNKSEKNENIGSSELIEIESSDEEDEEVVETDKEGVKVDVAKGVLFLPKSDYSVVDNALKKLVKIINTVPGSEVVASEPHGLRVTLYPHQSYGLSWLWWREQNYPGGGILADEMGLGKTIMMISLVLKCKADGEPHYEVKKNEAWLSNEKKLVPSNCTLIVVPPGVIGQWEQEIKSRARGLNFCLFYGPRRPDSAVMLSRQDIVLTTYQTLNSEIPKPNAGDDRVYRCNSVLMRINFQRVVLDEGHNIRNGKTNSAFACCHLFARHRWVVTGTPVHNKPSDMHSLVKFIGLKPFDDSKLWDYWIGLTKLSTIQGSAMRLAIIGKALILRRTKLEVAANENSPTIPEKHIKEIEIELTEGEREIYNHLEAFATSQFKIFLKSQDEATKEMQKAADKYVAGGRRPKKAGEVNYTHVFTLILRLRQCCVLPYLIHSMIEDDVDVDSDSDDTVLPENDEIISLRNPVFNEHFESAKITRLLMDINEIRTNCKQEGCQMDKVVVVSQWSSLLSIINIHLINAGYRTCEISGKVKVTDRSGIVSKFNSSNPKPQIMLLSLTAGGVGLNLVGANHLFFLDLHYNPQLELQAQDRIHRFGQKKPVTIYRYISQNTMENRVLELQKEKLELANNLLENKKTVSGGLTTKEMRKLFAV